MTDQEVIQEEIQSILDDIIVLYESQNKKVSGQFAEGLQAIYKPYEASIVGYLYLAGRKAGKMPPVGNIENWVKTKGIFNIKSESQARSIAFAIAKKISKEGTSKKYLLKVYESVITAERIDKIIDRVSQLNVNKIITQVRAELEILQTNV